MRADKLILLTAIAGILMAGWLIMGCEGPEGPQGPAGPAGPGLSGDAQYAGNNATTCGHCHGELTESWEGTGHSEAWAALGTSTTNPYCQQCHTTGFDDRFDHDGNRISTGVNNGGYDDTGAASLTGVQCEACHGPMGVNPAVHTPQVESSYRGETCAFCHDQPDEWTTSGHGSVLSRMTREEMVDEWGGSSCNSCHISEGFIKKYDADHAALTFDAETANPVTCVTCHDPHSAANAMQLRTVADVTSPYGGEDSPSGYAITGFGKGQLCSQCHHSRRSRTQILSQIDTGSEHPGPHESPQADMVSGRGCWELPGTYERENPHVGTLEDMCVNCHMYTIPRDQTGGPVFGHSFAADVNMCKQCHTSATDFDIHGIQTEIEAKLEELAALLPHDSTGAVMAEWDTLNWTREQREAGYVYLFVEADGSKGVHNPDYADSLLTNAIRYLSPSAVAEKPRPGVRG
jgi:hypothetical protein